MPNEQHWSPGNLSLSAPDIQNAGVTVVPSTDVALGVAGIPTQYKIYTMGLPNLNILYRTLTSITTPFPGAVSQMPMAGQSSAKCSFKVTKGPGFVTRGLIDPAIQNGTPIPNSTGITANATNLKVFTLS